MFTCSQTRPHWEDDPYSCKRQGPFSADGENVLLCTCLAYWSFTKCHCWELGHDRKHPRWNGDTLGEIHPIDVYT